MPKFPPVNGVSDKSWILCLTSFLGGIPLGSWNTPLYSCSNSSNWCLFSLVHPSKDTFSLIDSLLDLFILRKVKHISYWNYLSLWLGFHLIVRYLNCLYAHWWCRISHPWLSRIDFLFAWWFQPSYTSRGFQILFHIRQWVLHIIPLH